MYTCSIAPYVLVMGRVLAFSKGHCSLMPSPRAPPGENLSGEQS